MSEMDGIWDLDLETIRGNRTARLTLKIDGATASGSLDGDKHKRRLEFDNGRVKNNAVRWESNVTLPVIRREIKVTYTAIVDGDNISGTVDGPRQRLATFTGSRSG